MSTYLLRRERELIYAIIIGIPLFKFKGIEPMAKQLFRSKKNRKIAGICGGLGEFFDVDPIFFRVILLVSALFGGLGLVIYIVLWILMPEEKTEHHP